jgi:hypothetical protein
MCRWCYGVREQPPRAFTTAIRMHAVGHQRSSLSFHTIMLGSTSGADPSRSSTSPLVLSSTAHLGRLRSPARSSILLQLVASGRKIGTKQGSGKIRGRPAMRCIFRRLAIIVGATLAPLVIVQVASPALSNAAECGAGTVFDAPSNSCVAAPLPPAPPPPPPPPPPPAWNGDITPYFSVGVCAPVPFVSVCAGI